MRVSRLLKLILVLVFASSVFFIHAAPRGAAAQDNAGKKAAGRAAKKDAKKRQNLPPAEKSAVKTAADGTGAGERRGARVLSSGKRFYTLVQQGVRIGEESYSYSIGEDGKTTATAEIAVRSIAQADMVQKYTLEAGGALLSYTLEAVVNGEKQKLECACAAGEVKSRVYQNGTVETVSLRSRVPLFLLDNMNANNYQHIIDAYSHKAGGVQKFNVFVAQRLTLMELSVENRGFVKGRAAGKAAEFVEYRAFDANSGLEIFIYADKGGAVAAVIVPAQKFTIALEGFELEKTSRPPEVRDFVAGPFKVRESGVFFENNSGLRLYGKLVVPDLSSAPGASPGAGSPMKAAVIIAGSGPTDRDGNSPLINGRIGTLKDIAEHLAACGVASLRYDKRGVGESDPAGDSPFSEYVSDASAAVDFLCSRACVDSTGVYLIGHSEGALIAMSAAAASKKVRGLVLMAAPFTPFDKLIVDQVKFNLEYSVSISPSDRHEFIRQLSDAIKQLKKGQTPKLKEAVSVPSMDIVIKSLVGQPKFVGEYLNIMPAKLAAGVRVPVLLIGAALDAQVPHSDFAGYCEVFAKNKADFHKLMVEGVNHVFKPARAKNDAASYVSDSKVVSAALNAISSFMAGRLEK